MKKIIFILVLFLLSFFSSIGQSPQIFSYQFYIRDSTANFLNNQNINVLINIVQGSFGGTVVYSESFLTTTNSIGLVNLKIGTDTTISNFIDIDWFNGPYFIETAIKFLGGTQWINQSFSQIMSVPYSLHTSLADSIGMIDLEKDSIFMSSIASSITSSDTAMLNNYINTDTQLDSIAIANYGYVAGPHTIDTDTQLDSIAIANYGYVAGPHNIDTDTQLDSSGIANYGYVAGPHTIDTDILLDSIGIANYGYVAGLHTIDTDTQLDSIGIANYGYIAGNEVIDTDTQLDSIAIANYGYVAGPHTIDTDILLDSIGITNYGYVATKTYSIGLHPELGGYVFRVSPDGKHGLVVAMQNQSGPKSWYESGNIIQNPANHDINGQKFADWRLPTKYELNEIYPLRFSTIMFSTYWTSTQDDFGKAWCQNFQVNGIQSKNSKVATCFIRAVRSF